MSHQLDLWEKPFHSITVYEKPNPNTGGRSLVTRYDNLSAMETSIQRELDQHGKNPMLPRIAYIYACQRLDYLGGHKVVALETYYPIQ